MPDTALNPLLAAWDGPCETPDFTAIRAEHFLPAFAAGIAESRAEIAAITANPAAPDFDNTMAALERSGALLGQVRRIFYALSSAQSDDAIRAIENEVSATLTAHGTEISHNAALFARVKAVWEARDGLTPEQARLTDNSYKGYVAGGAALGLGDQHRLAAIDERLGTLSVGFGQNVLAATNASELILGPDEIGGIAPDLLIAAAARAGERGLADRFIFTIDRSRYESLLAQADVRSVRERVWRTFTSRCESGERNNLPAIVGIVALRQERARLLGYANFADYKLEDSMAKTPAAAEALMERVWRPALLQADRERDALQALVDRDGGGFRLAAWDWRYYAERLRLERFAYDAGAIRSHLSLDKVRAAAFASAERLYGLKFERRADIAVYHPDVIAWSVSSTDATGSSVSNTGGAPVGVIYTDYLARPEKHGGAWMGSLRVQETMDGRVLPIVYTVASFTRSVEEGAALLSLDEARTLFHEFGHALHALLSDVTYPSLAGTAVARDFVEFPSKLMEHWVVAPEALAGLGVPQALITAIARAETFGQGFATVEFLGSALVDLALHRADPSPTNIAAFEAETLAGLNAPDAIGMRHQLAVFTHVFDGGYASAYYSYLWSEVLDADVFAAFTAAGDLFDPVLAGKLRQEVLAKGDSRDPMESFIAFRGREPEENALLRARCLT